MMLLQQSIPDTTSYMIAGYTVIFAVILIYLVSIAVRHRNLERDLDVLNQLDKKDT
jgi:CcmD family protein